MNTARKNRKLRKVAGFFAGIGLSAAAIAMVAPAFMDPGPPAPVARALNLAATETARAAYLEAMKQQGYEILPPVTMAEVSATPAP